MEARAERQSTFRQKQLGEWGMCLPASAGGAREMTPQARTLTLCLASDGGGCLSTRHLRPPAARAADSARWTTAPHAVQEIRSVCRRKLCGGKTYLI